MIASTLLPLARLLDPETAHNLSMKALKFGLAGRDATPDDPILVTQAFGRTLKNPIGLAAGFDKNAVALAALSRLGFGFLEAGTVTPRPQAGNPRPRLFRLPADRAVINRMGFNNAGIDVFVANLTRTARNVPIGANIGINKEGADPERDYPALAAAVSPHADYITVNISSPNTPGLRDLQTEARLASILDAIAVPIPLFVKIAPDLAPDALESMIEVCVTRKIAGLIISNTTIARPHLIGPHAGETGGLSGAPLMAPSTKMLAAAYKLAKNRLTLIGAGGIFSAEDVFAKILAGATLVQLYTAFAYQGPALIPRLKTGLAGLLRRGGFQNITQAIGAGA